MSLIKKSNLKNHLSAKRLTSLHAIHLIAKQPEERLGVIDLTSTDANELGFESDFSVEHSSPGREPSQQL
ncbi:MAG TPA: hypothetical protein VM554_08375 [Acidisarcina sp.]|nr:hypothetical protein [Acidisarcina sp.]